MNYSFQDYKHKLRYKKLVIKDSLQNKGDIFDYDSDSDLDDDEEE